MKLKELIDKKIIIGCPKSANLCPKCGYPMKHGFRLNSYQCTNCGYDEESPNITSFKSK